MMRSFSIKRRALVCAAILLNVGQALGFLPSRSVRFDRTPFRLRALVFDNGETFYEDESYYGQGTPSSSLVAERLDTDRVAALARMAVAFCPDGLALNLNHLHHVHVMGVDENHLDIEAVVCEEESCVTVMVPVSFPHPCNGIEGMEECVMDNIDQLDFEAVSKLHSTGIPAGAAEEMPHADWKEMASNPPMYLPLWWEPSMDDDYNDLTQHFNDGYQKQIKELAMKELSFTDGGDELMVENAAIIAVCPLGVHIRAQARRVVLFEEDEIVIGEVSCAFDDRADDVAWVKAAVLKAFGSASDFADTFA